MKILITGSLGFIATNLIIRLSENPDIELIGIDNSSSKSSNHNYTRELCSHHVVDLCNQSQISTILHEVDIVVHLAALGNVVHSIADPISNFNSNVLSTVSLLEAMRSSSVSSIVFASTGGALMGNTPPPVNESSVPRPISPYGASKSCCEAYLSAYSGAYGFKAAILRFGNVYGPFSSHKYGVVNEWLRSAIRRESITIYGDGSSTRDYIHSSDIVHGLIRSIEYIYSSPKPLCDIFHLANSEEITLNSLFYLVASITGIDLQAEYLPSRTGEVFRNFADTSYAREILGFRPSTTFSDGLSDLYDWLRVNEYGGIHDS